MPHDRTDEFAKLPRGQRTAAIHNARVERARAAAELLRAAFKHEWAQRVPPVNVEQPDTQRASTVASVALKRVTTNG